jgi:hypothetical protein
MKLNIVLVLFVLNGMFCMNIGRNALVIEEPINESVLKCLIKCASIPVPLISMDTLVSDGMGIGTHEKYEAIKNQYTLHVEEQQKHLRLYSIIINYFELHTTELSTDHFNKFEKSINDSMKGRNISGKNTLGNNRYFFSRSVVVDIGSNRKTRTCEDYICIQNGNIIVEIIGKTLSKNSYKINEYLLRLTEGCSNASSLE